MPRVVFLRLRNRTLNRFKDIKSSKSIHNQVELVAPKTKSIKKNSPIKKLGFVAGNKKTLRVVPRLTRSKTDQISAMRKLDHLFKVLLAERRRAPMALRACA